MLPPLSVGAPGIDNAELVRRRLARPLDLIAEQGHGAIGEPVEQRRTFRIVDRRCVRAHLVLQLPPVANRDTNVAQNRAKLLVELPAAARVGAIELDVHHRFSAALVVAQLLDREQLSARVAVHADDGVKQPVNGQVARRDRVGDRVHQEGHVVIDDGDPHPPTAGFAAGRLDADCKLARLPGGGDICDEGSGLRLVFRPEAVQFPSQRIAHQRLLQPIDRRRRASHHRHVLLKLRISADARGTSPACQVKQQWEGKERPLTGSGRVYRAARRKARSSIAESAPSSTTS